MEEYLKVENTTIKLSFLKTKMVLSSYHKPVCLLSTNYGVILLDLLSQIDKRHKIQYKWIGSYDKNFIDKIENKYNIKVSFVKDKVEAIKDCDLYIYDLRKIDREMELESCYSPKRKLSTFRPIFWYKNKDIEDYKSYFNV